VALQPFLIWHLLGKLADLLSPRPKRSCNQRMTRGAQFRLSDLFSFGRSIPGSRRPHDSVFAIVDFERAEFRAFASLLRCIDDETTDETLACSKFVFLDLMA